MVERMHLFGSGLRQTAAWALVLAAGLFLLPAALVTPLPAGEETPPAQEEAALPLRQAAQAAQAASPRDRGRAVRLKLKDGTVAELTMADYIWGVVAAEMPASFQPEALKAQACAARTYTAVLQSSDKHEDADICADSTCCQAYVERSQAEARWGLNAQEYSDKITAAVTQTDGLGVLYQGRPIQALFFSSAAGRTVDAVAVWGSSVDYLRSVDSPEGEEVPNYHTRTVLSRQEAEEIILAAYPGADLSGGPEAWLQDVVRDEGGTVTSLKLGGLSLTGGQVRTLFGLRSAAFSASFQDDSFIFDVTGYGHGVGMSQYGANAMAKEGSSFRDILTWYYSGTEVGELW